MGGGMFNLRQVDCVTFTERCLALACAGAWDQYYIASQRLRYGSLSTHFLDRNFFTLTDWVPNNAWLLDDVTSRLGVPTIRFNYVVRPRQFFERLEFGEDATPKGRAKVKAKAAKIASVAEKIVHEDQYVDRSLIAELASELRSGDVLLIIRKRTSPGMAPWYDCDHIGILINDDGVLSIAHAVPPQSVVESLDDFLESRPWVVGLKILRPKSDQAKIRQYLSQLIDQRRSTHETEFNVPTPDDIDSAVVDQTNGSEAERVSSCVLAKSITVDGGGCCDTAIAPVCDRRSKTTTQRCVDACAEHLRCAAKSYNTIITYEWVVCFGDCTGCVVVDGGAIAGLFPTSCDCKKSADAS